MVQTAIQQGRKSSNGPTREYNLGEPVIFLVDDDQTYLDYMNLILETLEIRISAFSSAGQFLQHCPPEPVGVLITDVLMPGTSGVELQKILIRESVSLPVIFLTGFANPALVREALNSGAFDFIEKPVNPEDLISSARRAVAASLQNHKKIQREKAFREKLDRLTARELQILRLMLDYEQTCNIVDKLSISARTVESHKSSIFKKMEVDGFVELACQLIRIADVDI